MNSPFHTEAPEKVREVPAVAPAKAHHGEGPRGILFMVLYMALLVLLVFGCYHVFSNPFSHYPYHKIDRAEMQDNIANPGDAPSDSSTPTENATILQPVAQLAANNGVTGTDVPGWDTVVATFEGHELTNQEFIYYYWDVFYNLYNTYGTSFYSYINMAKPFDQQAFDETQTWHEYLSSIAVHTWHQTKLLCQDAETNGFTLLPEDEEYLRTNIDQLDTYAADNGYASADAYVQNLFDPCTSVESYEAYNRDMLLASSYADHLYNSIYEDNFDPNAQVSYCVNVRHILIQAEDPSNADSMAAAKVRAEDLYAQWQADPTEDNFINMAGTHTEDPGSQGTGGLYEDIYPGQMVTNFNDWCFDEARQPGDHGIVETKYGYHIMYFVGDSEKPYADPNATVANEKYNAKLEALFTQEEPENLTENAVFTAKAQ